MSMRRAGWSDGASSRKSASPDGVPWDIELEVDEAASAPLYVRIADALRRDIVRGRLEAGQRLPGARSLAARLTVHRNTVTAAYDELEQQGWLRTEPARGRFVLAPGPQRVLDEREAVPRVATYALGAPPPAQRPVVAGELDLAGGLPDPRFFPTEALGRAYRRAVARGRWLDYGPPEGNPELRAALAQMLSATRGLAARAEDVLVTRGSQHALWLASRALLSPNDHVAVESYGYRPAWQALRATGATVHAVPVDAGGMDIDRLAALCARHRIRAVYVTPHHQYPTTVALAAPRRAALLELARRHRFAIFEDDYDHELHYEGRPLLPLASRDTSGSVVYIGTLSKVLAPGLRIGYVVAPPAVLARLAAWRYVMDRQGDLAVEAAVAELMEEGEVPRHVHRMRKAYGARRDALLDALERSLPGVLSFTVPRGGMSIWAQAPGVDVERWRARCQARGVALRVASDFAFDGRARPWLRLGFARCTEGELRDAVERMRRALPRRGG